MSVATIIEIMESWPLGLRLRFEGEREDTFRDLAEDCQILSAGTVASASDLRRGMKVRVSDADSAIERIEII